MPLYEYQCEQCGRFERIQKFSDALLTTCPTCGSVVQKLLSQSAIRFKGTGWYVTDYAGKKKGGSESGKGKDTSSKDSAGKDTSGTDTSSKDSSGKGSAKSDSTPSSSTTTSSATDKGGSKSK